MLGAGKRIKEEFGLQDEAQAVQEYSALNSEVMYPNYPLIADEVLLRLGFIPARILDLGTGLGTLAIEFAKRLPQAKILGLDISPEMLQAAGKRAPEKYKGLRFVSGDVHKCCLKDSLFDLIVSFGVLHHLHDLRAFFLNVFTPLKSGGAAFIYDLKKEAPAEIVAEIASGMNPLHQKAFLESQKESLDRAHLESFLKDIPFSTYALSQPRYSRSTLIKNKEMLRQSSFLGERFNSILWECFLKK